jgi:radical SAM protein with 4Fe4S-binding SPASM domain
LIRLFYRAKIEIGRSLGEGIISVGRKLALKWSHPARMDYYFSYHLLMKNKLSRIIFEVCTTCSLDCRYCYNIWKIPGNNHGHYNSYSRAKRALKKLFKQAEINHITFSGGEPLLAERFLELVLYCRLKSKSVTIITNGNSGNAAAYKELHEMRVNLFELPFHSAKPEEHDYLTRVPGSWDKVVRSMDEMLDIGAKVVCVIVITRANHSSLTETLGFLHKKGIKQVMLNRFNIGGSGIAEKKNLLLTKQELKSFFRLAGELGKKYKLLLSSNVCTPRCIIEPADFPNIRFSYCYPEISGKPITMDIFGNLRVCNHSPVIIGNIFKSSLEEIFSSEYAESWVNIIPDYCKECGKYSRCFGGCRAAAEQLGLTLKEPDPVISELF